MVDRMPKKIFTQELEGTRRRGRLRKTWKELMNNLINLLYIGLCIIVIVEE